MTASARSMVLHTPGGVRLLGSFSPRRTRTGKGLVLLLHGWEGSIDSTYMLTTGRRFHAAGYDVFRLNFRDHGKSHHLNRGLFFATLLDEVFEAVRQAAGLSGGLPVFLAGFSLGGNFALRIARQSMRRAIPGLRHVVAVSPALNPSAATDSIDGDALILRYFLKKWTRSLRRKAALFPERYDFSEALRFRTLRRITDALVPLYTGFTDAEAYFRGYAVDATALAGVTLPMTIIAADDDPVIPAADFRRLKLGPGSRLVLHSHGGHMGFVEDLSMKCWHERKMVQLFDRLVEARE